MSFLDKIFGGGSSSKKSSPSSGSSKSSTPTFKSLSEAAKAGYHGQAVNIAGKGKQKVSFGDKSYDKKMAAASNAASRSRDSSGGGLKSIGNALRNAPKNIARDIGMGFNPSSRDADYYRRTANTIARTQGKAAADRYISQMTQKGGLAAAGVKNADVSGSVNYGQRIGMLNVDGSVNTKYMRSDDGGSGSITPNPEDVQSPAEQTQVNQAMLNRMRMQQEQAARAANMDRARMMFERQNMMSPGPMPRQMQGLGGFRRQLPPGMNQRFLTSGSQINRDSFGMPLVRGIPRRYPQPMPRYPQPMPRNQASSPAFRYAAQNYDRLGGMQRTMPRPMEMMSRAERQQIGRIADRMPRPPELRTMRNPYVDILQRGISAKGGGRTMPQRGQFNSMQELMDYQNQNPSMNLMGEYQRLKALEGGGQPVQMPRFGGKGRGGVSPQFPKNRMPGYGGMGTQPTSAPPNFGSILASRFGRFGRF